MDATICTRILEAGGEITGKSVCENLCLWGASSSAATGKSPFSSQPGAQLLTSDLQDQSIMCTPRDTRQEVPRPEAVCSSLAVTVTLVSEVIKVIPPSGVSVPSIHSSSVGGSIRLVRSGTIHPFWRTS